MRARVAGRAAAGLGVSALAVAGAALVLPGPSAPARDLALDPAYETVAVGAGVTFLDPVTLEQRTGADVSVSVRVDEDPDSGAGDEGTAVRAYDTTTTASDGTLIASSTTTVCLDRRTAEAVDCAAEAVDGQRTDIRGLTLAFPPATAERDRMMWDDTVRASFPVRFAGTERFRGLQVQRYEHLVPEQVVRAVTVPGALVGSAEENSPADVVHSTSRVLLVEPVSGVIVSTEELPLTQLRAPDGAPGAVLLGGAFVSSEESIRGAVARAREVLDRRDASTGALPWVLGPAGVVLLGVGGFLIARDRVLPAERAEDEPVRQLAPVA